MPRRKTKAPLFFSARQLELVAVLCDLIIPDTTTPGARSAGVHDYIDVALSRASPTTQRTFVAGLAWIDRKSVRRFGRRFLALGLTRQVSLLDDISDGVTRNAKDRIGQAFFQDIKDRTIHAYYTSRIGILQELGYTGNTPLPEFPGCRHPGHPEGQHR